MSHDVTLNAQTTHLDFAKSLALGAGEIMTHLEGGDFIPSPGADYINEYVAKKIEDHIEKRLAARFPEHDLFGNKNLGGRNNEYEWICDYIDGAYCYSKEHKISVTSIALQRNNKTIVSAIYNPWTRQLFYASLDGGAFLNDNQITVSNEGIQTGTLVNVEWWPWADYDVDSWLHQVSIDSGIYVLHIGSIIHASCLVASGTFGAAALGKSMIGKNHEIAAIKLIVEEAGGIITDLRGEEIGYTNEIHGLLIGNQASHQILVKSYIEYEK